MNLLKRQSGKKTTAQTKFHIKRGDTVFVLNGKCKGQTGVVKTILTRQNKALVEGINVIKKSVKPNPMAGQQGGIIEMESPIAISNLMVYDLANSQPTRSKVGVVDGKRVRIAKKSGEQLDD